MSANEQRTGPILQPYVNLHLNDNLFPVSAKPRGWEWRMNLGQLPFPHLFTWGGLGEWLAGSSLVLHPCQRAGGDGGQDNSIFSYVPSSMIPGLCIPNNSNLWLPSSPLMDKPLILSPFSPLNWMALLACFLRKLGMTGLLVRKSCWLGKVVGPKTSSLPFLFPGTSSCPSGDWDRGLAKLRFSLQPRGVSPSANPIGHYWFRISLLCLWW